MCVGLSQLQLDYDKASAERNWEKMVKIHHLIDQIKETMPRSYRINLWKKAVILPQVNPFEPRLAQFAWVEKKKDGKTWPVFNVRVEGGWGNKTNDPNYKGDYGIFSNPYVKDLIMEQRCIVPCDFFIEQPNDKKIKKKFVVKKKDGTPIHLAGVYKEFVDEETGEISTSFTIKTTAYSKITIQADHHRSPVIIPDEYIFDYLDPSTTKHQLEAFFPPPESEGFIAYEVDPIIAKRDCPLEENDPKLIEPVGEILEPVE